MVKEQIKHVIQEFHKLIATLRVPKPDKILAFADNKLMHIRHILTLRNKEPLQPIESILKVIRNKTTEIAIPVKLGRTNQIHQ
jgi:hypothetical protein